MLRTLVTPLLEPIPWIILLMLCACLLLWFRSSYRWARWCVTAATILMLLFSFPQLPRFLLHQLEKDYATKAHSPQAISWIVVLGGGAIAMPQQPAQVQLFSESLQRLVTGIALLKHNPQAKLLISGGDCGQSCTEARLMQQTAKMLGVDNHRLLLESASKNTQSQVLNIKKIIHQQPFYLVTSAYHLKRSLKMFHAHNMHPIPVASNFLFRSDPTRRHLDFMPRARNLLLSAIYLHEWFGLLWFNWRY